jgi:hypothetical protein
MKSILFSILTLTFGFGLPTTIDAPRFEIHEWGTFTSVAGESGTAIPWQPFGGPTDLPCFVDRVRNIKIASAGTVRMETPVLYFYASHEAVANVKVRFPKGTITEWYPQAATSVSNTIEWRQVHVAPASTPDFPVETARSHYYAARETDAAPLEVGSQKEKFLFYRGVGTFSLPVSVKITDDGKILVRNLGSDAVKGIIFFENRGGRKRYAVAGTLANETVLDFASLNPDASALEVDLERILIEQGLYQAEARAMIETWRDSWFEEGARLFYIVPSRVIDSVLPLDVQPAPAQISRVFVGRMEVITPAIEEDVKQALTEKDRATLEKYGRFLEPISKRLGLTSPLLDSVYSRYLSQASGCP